MNFKDLFADLLNEREITQREFSRRTKIPPTTISGWLNLGRLPDFNAIIKISKFFEVSTDYLLGLEDDFGAKEFDAPKIEHYSKAERELIATYRTLSPGKKSALFEMLEIEVNANRHQRQK